MTRAAAAFIDNSSQSLLLMTCTAADGPSSTAADIANATSVELGQDIANAELSAATQSSSSLFSRKTPAAAVSGMMTGAGVDGLPSASKSSVAAAGIFPVGAGIDSNSSGSGSAVAYGEEVEAKSYSDDKREDVSLLLTAEPVASVAETQVAMATAPRKLSAAPGIASPRGDVKLGHRSTRPWKRRQHEQRGTRVQSDWHGAADAQPLPVRGASSSSGDAALLTESVGDTDEEQEGVDLGETDARSVVSGADEEWWRGRRATLGRACSAA